MAACEYSMYDMLKNSIVLLEPASVFPTRRANEYASGGERLRLGFHSVAVEGYVRSCGFSRALSTSVGNQLALLPKISEQVNPSVKLAPLGASYPPPNHATFHFVVTLYARFGAILFAI